MPIRTKEKLAQVLHARGLFRMEAAARKGRYDDFESESASPIFDLVTHLRHEGHHDLAKRAMHGEWDSTLEESEAWADSADGRSVFSDLIHKN